MEETQQPDVTVLVPALNEEDTISEVLNRVLALPLRLQVIVIDDGSDDATPTILKEFGDQIEVITNPQRSGKGMAIREGLEIARGEVVVIQDADLEYAPEDLTKLVQPIRDGSTNVVYGTRFLHGLPPSMKLPNKIVNVLLRWSVSVLFWRRISDEATCYKAFRRTVLQRMHLECTSFEFCPEVTAKAFRLGERILELPIRYEARSYAAGKKIRWTDAPIAFWTLLKHRFSQAWRRHS